MTRTSKLVVLGLAAAAISAAAIIVVNRRPSPIADTPRVPSSPGWFEDVTDNLGIDFTHDAGPKGNYLLPQINGSGCALCDLDGDGRPDLLFLSHGSSQSKSMNKLYRQKPDGTFEDVTAGSGLDFAGECMGVAVGDVNNDGRPDILITLNGGVRLFLNLGGMKFRDISEEAGVSSRGWATSACFVDYNRDGRLDLVVVHGADFDPSWVCTEPDGNRGYCSPNVFPGAVTRLFRNDTPSNAERIREAMLALIAGTFHRLPEAWREVRFRDVTLESGLGRLPGPGLGVVCADFDGDGWPDIFVANDAKPNHLWINQRDGTFAEEGLTRGVAYNSMGKAWAGMGVALGDINNHGLLDILVSHLGIETNTLWMQGPRGLYRDKTGATGLAAGAWRATGWGITLSDFDHDGKLDCAVVNGRVARGPDANANPALGSYWSPYAERNQLFAGIGTGEFRDRSGDEPAFSGAANCARGLAVGDIDGDGALDLVVTTIDGRARVFRNVCPNRGHWVLVRCVDPEHGGRDALGAEVTVAAGGVKRLRLADPGGTFLSSSDPRAHFGLGESTTIDAIEVRWSDGIRESFHGGPADRQYTLQKGTGRAGGR